MPTPRHRLGRQAWVRGCGPEVPSADAILAPSPGWRVKPDGCLWTSTWGPHGGSGWVRWCLERDWGARPFDVWLLDPHRAARVLAIDSRRDLTGLLDRYGDPGSARLAVDWTRVARDFDAVHLSERGHDHASGEHPELDSWESESTVWFRWGFVRVVHYGEFPASRS